MNVAKALGNIKLGYIYALLLVIMIFPLFYPFTLPIPIDPYSQNVYDIIENLPAGSNVLYIFDVQPASWTALGPGSIALLEHLFRCPLKVVIVTFQATAPGLVPTLLSKCPSSSSKQYGVDYIFLGFVAGAEAGAASFASNIRGVFSKDFIYNKPIDEWSIMEGINSAKDFQLIVEPTDMITLTEYYIRQMKQRYGIPIVSCPSFVDIPQYENYYRTNLIGGYIKGARGIADYERLLGYAGDGTKVNGVMTAVHLYALVLFVMANIAYFTTKFEERRRGNKND